MLIEKISRKLPDIAKEVDRLIDEAAGEKVAFTLMIFTEGRAQYISSCDRADSTREIRRMLDYWESGAPDIEAHKVN